MFTFWKQKGGGLSEAKYSHCVHLQQRQWILLRLPLASMFHKYLLIQKKKCTVFLHPIKSNIQFVRTWYSTSHFAKKTV